MKWAGRLFEWKMGRPAAGLGRATACTRRDLEPAGRRQYLRAVKVLQQHWRANFLTGLAVVLPAVISLAIFRWLFGTVSNITDSLLFFLPRAWTHEREGEGTMMWYWSLAALVLAFLLITAIGRAARNYFGKQLIKGLDTLLSRVPLLNKIYSTVKQVNDAFTTSSRSAFKQVVLVEYPRKGIYSIGFLTADDMPEPRVVAGRPLCGIFIPTTPNPTSGFLIVVPADEVIRLRMSVADGIKYVISLGSIVPEHQASAARERGSLEPSHAA